MAIERFVWTDHALQRLGERGLTRFEAEELIREAHDGRVPNEDGADWLITGKTERDLDRGGLRPSPWRGRERGTDRVDLAARRRGTLTPGMLGRVRYAYYDRDADIAWFPTGLSDDVVSKRVPGGLRDYDRSSHELVAIEIWSASTRLPANLLDALPAPVPAQGAAA